jgi:hypothetical protein
MAKSEESKHLKSHTRHPSLQRPKIHIPDHNDIFERDRRYLENFLSRVNDKVVDRYERLKKRA